MDNLTHSLVGALLGQCGLKRLSGRSMATLVIAANLPDIDAFATLLGTESLAFRRGITHGPIAMLLLPLALTGLVLAWDRWRPLAQPVRPGPLLLLAFVGTLSHPALDFLNSYGIRLLEPFSSKWVYGDTLFIIDLWIWAALLVGFIWSRRRERRGGNWRRPAIGAGAAILAYVGANAFITARIEQKGAEAYRWEHAAKPDLVVANPVPITFWRRQVLWRGGGNHGRFPFSFFDRRLISARPDVSLGQGQRIGLDHPALAASRGRADVEAFLFWSRMPFVAEESGRAFLMDQRFSSRLTRDTFRVPLDTAPRAP